MAATVTQIATALATKLATVSGLRTFNYQPEQINPPIAFPVLTAVTYHRAFQGGDVMSDWDIIVVVGRYTDSRAFAALDGYLSYDGASSVRAALEDDRTLGGVVKTLILSNGAQIMPQEQGEAEYLMVRFNCQVHS